MNRIKTVGLPIMRKEKNEVRGFLPSFVTELTDYGVETYMEYGYGKGMGIKDEVYLKENSQAIHLVSHEEAYKQDLVIVLRAPNFDELALMRRRAGLVAMLHYKSRPRLVQELKKYGIISYSLDSMVDDNNQRLVVSYETTAWNGVHIAFKKLEKRRGDFYSPNREPFWVAIMGMGNLGIQAGRASFRFGDERMFKKIAKHKLPGVSVAYLEKEVTYCTDFISNLFTKVDVLIDATKRIDFTKYIIPNNLLGNLKKDALILDLTCDPYDTSVNPIQVKAIEGIPTGTLDQYIFEVNDPAWDKIPDGVSTINRRVVISCNAWPGITPKQTMQIYGEKIIPFTKLLIEKGHSLSLQSDNLVERVLCRSTLTNSGVNP